MTPQKLTHTLLETMELHLDSTRETQLMHLQQWLANNIKSWSKSIRRDWSLDDYSLIRLPDYPTEESTLNLREEFLRLQAVPPTTLDQLAMRVRDIFWQGLTTLSDTTCARCGVLPLTRLEEPVSHMVVLSCDNCCWSQTLNGARWTGGVRLQPASRQTLRTLQASVQPTRDPT